MARQDFDDGQFETVSMFPAPPTAVKRLMIVYSIVFAICVLLYVVSKESFVVA